MNKRCFYSEKFSHKTQGNNLLDGVDGKQGKGVKDANKQDVEDKQHGS